MFTPHVARVDLWKTSGHWGYYRENMFTPMQLEDAEYQLKPMNCPFHILIYKDQRRSYRELPMRLAEFGTVYRYERSGVMHGLLRVRGFTQDDAHIFAAPESVESEAGACVDFALMLMKIFGFDKYEVELSTWDPADRDEVLRRARAVGNGGEAPSNRRWPSATSPFRRMRGRGGFLRAEDRHQAARRL